MCVLGLSLPLSQAVYNFALGFTSCLCTGLSLCRSARGELRAFSGLFWACAQTRACKWPSRVLGICQLFDAPFLQIVSFPSFPHKLFGLSVVCSNCHPSLQTAEANACAFKCCRQMSLPWKRSRLGKVKSIPLSSSLGSHQTVKNHDSSLRIRSKVPSAPSGPRNLSWGCGPLSSKLLLRKRRSQGKLRRYRTL